MECTERLCFAACRMYVCHGPGPVFSAMDSMFSQQVYEWLSTSSRHDDWLATANFEEIQERFSMAKWSKHRWSIIGMEHRTYCTLRETNIAMGIPIKSCVFPIIMLIYQRVMMDVNDITPNHAQSFRLYPDLPLGKGLYEEWTYECIQGLCGCRV